MSLLTETDNFIKECVEIHGLTLLPGLVDIHVHFREPGYEHKEDIKSGAMAAVRGGYTTVACMANTNPVVDSAEFVRRVYETARDAPARLLQFGAATKGMDGREIADYAGMKAAGIAGISEDGKVVEDESLMLEVLLKANSYQLAVFTHCDSDCDNEAELVERDILLAEKAGARLHICHISTTESAEITKKAKVRGVKVTCEVTPHHLFLCKDDIKDNDTNFKMSPPLRTKEDNLALQKALKDGTIDCIATDHAPHSAEEKRASWETAPNGVTGLETAFAVCYTGLVKTGILTLDELIEKMSVNPAKILGIKRHEKDLFLADLKNPFIIDAESHVSKSKNSPFIGREVYGRVKATILGGKVVYRGTHAWNNS